MKESVYLTTSPRPPGRQPDVDLAFELVGADAFARYQRLRGRDVRVVAATVEQGKSVERLAFERGGTPQDLVDHWAEQWDATLQALDVAHDDHVRTTQARHQRVVKAVFLKLFDQGDIYKGTRQGPYCPRCAEFVPDGAEACPTCQGPLTDAGEEAFFLRASNHQKNILARLLDGAGLIVPEERARAVAQQVKESGVSDLAISRASHPWAIAVPIDPDHTIEPWFDALLSYLTGSAYLAEPQTFERYWPPTVQIIADHELATHSVAWPALLMSLGLPLPGRLVTRGTMNLEDDQHGEPRAIAEHYGADALRLALLNDFAYTSGGTLSIRRLVELHNERLAGNLSRLVESVTRFAADARDATIPRPGQFGSREDELAADASGLLDEMGTHIHNFDFPAALARLWHTAAKALDYWKPVADRGAAAATPRQADTALYVAAEACRLIALALWPLLPRAAEAIMSRLGLDPREELAKPKPRWGHLEPGTRVVPDGPLAPPLEP